MKWIKKYLYNVATKIIRNRITNDGTILCDWMLFNNGWTCDEDGYFSEQNVKKRDSVFVKFSHPYHQSQYYRVFHGENKTFIALDSTVEWLELYLLLMDKHTINKINYENRI